MRLHTTILIQRIHTKFKPNNTFQQQLTTLMPLLSQIFLPSINNEQNLRIKPDNSLTTKYISIRKQNIKQTVCNKLFVT